MANKNKTDQDGLVLQLLAKVKQKKSEIQTAERPVWETNTSFSYNPDAGVSDRVNLQTISDIRKLVDIHSFIGTKATSWVTSTNRLQVDIPFAWMGSSAKAWENDIKTRINQLNIKIKKLELDALEKRIDALISPEQRRELELAEITKMLE